MRLNKLTLQNFKGVEKFTLKPMGKNVIIRGENGTGKTTVADAYAWVTCGKSFNGDSLEPEIKKRDPATGLTPNDGGVVHAVEAAFTLDNGLTFTIRKEYVEKWEKKRGAAESEFRGNTTNYFINDVPLQEKEYKKRVAEIIPEEAGRLLSVPLYFCSKLKWNERRKILLDIWGEVSDADLFDKEEFSPLKKLLAGKTIEDYCKTVKAQMKKTNEELKAIPARIDELAQVEESAVDTPKNTIETHLKESKAKRQEAAAKIARLENGGESAEIQKEIAGIEAKMTKHQATLEAAYTRQKGDTETTIRGCISEIERVGATMEDIQKHIDQLEAGSSTIEEAAQKLREEWAAENAKEPKIDVSDVCPCCGQTLPPEKLEEARGKAIADFNRRKAETLTGITVKGKRMMEQKAKKLEEITASKNRLELLTQQVSKLADQKAAAEKTLATLAKPDISLSQEYQRLEAQETDLLEKLNALQQGDNSAQIAAAKEKLAAIDAEIAADNEKLAAIQQAENVKKRKADLLAREKELGEIYSNFEKNLDLAEKFVRAKVKLTEENINRHFKHVRFLMFRPQQNGGLEECCEPTIDGVPFGIGLNTGNEMKAALDILHTFSEHYQLNLPVFIDNCESYTSESLIPIDHQIIRLVVTEGQKNLSIEIEGEGQQAIAAVSREAA